MAHSRTVIPETLTTLYYLSDTHLEESVKKHVELPTLNNPNNPNDKTLMGLLGDIGWFTEESYWELVMECVARFNYVVLILGNHECHHEYIQEVPMKLRDALRVRQANFPELKRVFFLENDVLEFENVRIFGSTFWTKPLPSVFMKLNDRRYIRDKTYANGVLRIQTVYDINEKALECFRNELRGSTKPLVVLSHHAPLAECNGMLYANSSYTSAFVNYLEDDFCEPLIAWLYGHTHQNMTFIKNGIYIGTNALGYHKERLLEPYEVGKSFAVTGFRAPPWSAVGRPRPRATKTKMINYGAASI